VGDVITTIGLLHLVVAPAVYPDSLRSILEGGVLGSIDAEPAVKDLRSTGFWYVTAGLTLVVVGVTATNHEQVVGRPPGATAWGLLGLSMFGTALMPVSGFPLLSVPAMMSIRRHRVTGSPGKGE
jgi:hypothetical protein